MAAKISKLPSKNGPLGTPEEDVDKVLAFRVRTPLNPLTLAVELSEDDTPATISTEGDLTEASADEPVILWVHYPTRTDDQIVDVLKAHKYESPTGTTGAPATDEVLRKLQQGEALSEEEITEGLRLLLVGPAQSA